VSDTPRYTIRFTPEDYAILDALCQQFGLKRPDALRRALRDAVKPRPIARTGCFHPVGGSQVVRIQIGGRHAAT
jgi:hypothetical protein